MPQGKKTGGKPTRGPVSTPRGSSGATGRRPSNAQGPRKAERNRGTGNSNSKRGGRKR